MELMKKHLENTFSLHHLHHSTPNDEEEQDEGQTVVTHWS